MKSRGIVLEIGYTLPSRRGSPGFPRRYRYDLETAEGGCISLNLPERPPRQMWIRVVAIEPEYRDFRKPPACRADGKPFDEPEGK